MITKHTKHTKNPKNRRKKGTFVILVSFVIIVLGRLRDLKKDSPF